MKLYEVPIGSRIKVPLISGENLELNFDHMDGMCSFCTDDDGKVYHVAAHEEVVVVNDSGEKNVVSDKK